MAPLSGISGGFQVLLTVAVAGVCVGPLSGYMAHIYAGHRTWLTPWLAGIEDQLYRTAGIDPRARMTWRGYGLCGLIFLTGVLALPLIAAPLGEMARAPVATVETCLMGAVGMSAFVAGARGLSGRDAGPRDLGNIGNFWIDLVRTLLYIVLPLSLVVVALDATAGVGDALDAGIVAPGAAGGLLQVHGGGVLSIFDPGGLAGTPTARFLRGLSLLLLPAALIVALYRLATSGQTALPSAQDA